MIRMRIPAILAALCMISIGSELAMAQVPPHNPGTICVTPKFWCWAKPPGPRGAACFCATPEGAVRGVLD